MKCRADPTPVSYRPLSIMSRRVAHGRAVHASTSRPQAGHPDPKPTRWSRPWWHVCSGRGSTVMQARQVMQALAVYPAPVSAVGVDFLLEGSSLAPAWTSHPSATPALRIISSRINGRAARPLPAWCRAPPVRQRRCLRRCQAPIPAPARCPGRSRAGSPAPGGKDLRSRSPA